MTLTSSCAAEADTTVASDWVCRWYLAAAHAEASQEDIALDDEGNVQFLSLDAAPDASLVDDVDAMADYLQAWSDRLRDDHSHAECETLEEYDFTEHDFKVCMYLAG